MSRRASYSSGRSTPDNAAAGVAATSSRSSPSLSTSSDHNNQLLLLQQQQQQPHQQPRSPSSTSSSLNLSLLGSVSSTPTLTTPTTLTPRPTIPRRALTHIDASIQVFLRNHVLFKDLHDDEFIVSLAAAMQMRVYADNSYVIRKGEVGRAMFFVLRGEVEVVTEDGETVINVMKEESFFGEIGVLFSVPRTASCRARGRCIILTLTKDGLQKAVANHTEVAETIQSIAEERFASYMKQMETSMLVEFGQELKLGMTQNDLKKIPLFRDCSFGFLHMLSLRLKPLQYRQNDILIHKGEVASEMYFVVRGTAEVFSEEDGTCFAEFYPGSFFGEVGVFFHVKRTASVRCTSSQVSVFKLDKHDLDDVLKQYPEVRAVIKKEARVRFRYNEEREKSKAGVAQQEATEVEVVRERIKTVPLFKDADICLLHQLALVLKLRIYEPGASIIKKDEVGTSMYFVLDGTAEVVSEDGGTIYAELNATSFFGEVALLFEVNRTATVRSRTRTTLFELCKDALTAVLDQNSTSPSGAEFARTMRERAKANFELFQSRQRKVEEMSAGAPVAEEFGLEATASRLKQVPIFQNCDEGFIRQVALGTSARQDPKDTLIVSQGEISREMFFIIRGIVEIISADGRVVYDCVRDGGFFGEVGLLRGIPRTASVRVASAVCSMMVLTADALANVFRQYPESYQNIVVEADRRFRATEARRIKAEEAGAAGLTASSGSSGSSMAEMSMLAPTTTMMGIPQPSMAASVAVVTTPPAAQSTVVTQQEAAAVELSRGSSEEFWNDAAAQVSDSTSRTVKAPPCWTDESQPQVNRGSKRGFDFDKLFRRKKAAKIVDVRGGSFISDAGSSVGSGIASVRAEPEVVAAPGPPAIVPAQGPRLMLTRVGEPAVGTGSTHGSIEIHASGDSRRGSSNAHATGATGDDATASAAGSRRGSSDVAGAKEEQSHKPSKMARFMLSFRRSSKGRVNKVAPGSAAGGVEDAPSPKTARKLAEHGDSGKTSAETIRNTPPAEEYDEYPHKFHRNGSSVVTPTSLGRVSAIRIVPAIRSTLQNLKGAPLRGIVAYLNPLDRLKMRLLCRRWNDQMRDPIHWRTLDFYPLFSYATPKTFMTLWELSGEHLAAVSLKSCWRIDDAALIILARLCPNILALSLSNCWKFTEDGLAHLATSLARLRAVDLSYCGQIRGACLVSHKWHDLRELDLAYCKQIGSEYFEAMLARISELRVLRIRRCINMTDASVFSVVRYCRTLQVFDAADCDRLTDRSLKWLATSNKHLRHLDLTFCKRLTNAGLYELSLGTQSFTHLDFSFCSHITDAAVVFFTSSIRKLRFLSLRGCKKLTNHAVKHLARYAPELKVLDLRSCVLVTDGGREMFVNARPACRVVMVAPCMLSPDVPRAMEMPFRDRFHSGPKDKMRAPLPSPLPSPPLKEHEQQQARIAAC
ncbi:hypothetical protein HDU87_000523 [Geranomyces variabilis]|uniref:Cyclic nucleotide-binding domain-containing protein n=1 Tax=Geranomyces variabilis TaxID=109894 RepID=A0AAD5XLT0_9FUNG|nr:hypothetical protein HDU87_000523 [Geranomyces variabilis]